ncbi:hypothetical protein LCM02_14565 [Lutimonas saemankumensis]|uniref:hypothetical protein n=1 Tax=Lutimonas saemankumensis TaxID=483016 RepID=UPI001CD72282|nr:hypothetical protein [Lutimonas saemankumensis]MCA0933685.1 hypothetical protein [Lutimonas saemankumensis]
MEKVTIFVFLFCLPLLSIAQIDNNNAQETDVFQYEPENKNSMEYVPEDAESRDITAETVTVFGTIKEIAEKFPTHSVVPEKRRRSLSDFNQREKDVLVSQYWNGQDVSVKKFQTSLELGKLETSSKSIKIICRDHSYVDGDRVKLYVNEEVVRRSITLRAGYYTINVNLKEGFNRIDIEALNQGSSGPNTAEFKVLDENGILLADKEWNILTGYIATLVVMRN